MRNEKFVSKESVGAGKGVPFVMPTKEASNQGAFPEGGAVGSLVPRDDRQMEDLDEREFTSSQVHELRVRRLGEKVHELEVRDWEVRRVSLWGWVFPPKGGSGGMAEWRKLAEDWRNECIRINSIY